MISFFIVHSLLLLSRAIETPSAPRWTHLPCNSVVKQLAMAFCARTFSRLTHSPIGASTPKLYCCPIRTIAVRRGSRSQPTRLNVFIGHTPKRKYQFFCSVEFPLPLSGWASSITAHSSATDPAEAEALQCLEQGTQKLEEGDVQGAKLLYKRSVEVKRNASSLFNLGVTHYHLSVCFCVWIIRISI